MSNKTINKIITGFAIATVLVCGTQREAEAGSAELFVGDKSATFDTKVNIELGQRTNLFLRNRLTSEYDNDVGYFGVADLSVNIIGGSDGVLEGQVTTESGIIPRIGLQYFKKMNDVSIYSIGTCGIKSNPDGELLFNIGYEPVIGNDLKVLANLENITNFSSQGHNFSIQRIRLGLGVDDFGFGAAVDLNETGNKGEVNYKFGGFVAKKF